MEMKSTTVIKRMVQDGWKPISIIVLTICVIALASISVENTFGIDRNIVYYGLVGLWFFGAILKWGYDATKSRIEYEQNKILRDLGKKND
jgi:hypothetical protein